jgi:hypothetical protein
LPFGSLRARTTTDERGWFELHVPGGEFDVHTMQAQDEGGGVWIEFTRPAKQGVHPGGRPLQIVVDDPPPPVAHLKLRVVDQDGAPLPDAWIEVSEARPGARGWHHWFESDHGRFRLSLGRPGPHWVWITAKGHRPQRRTIDAIAGRDLDMGTVRLARGGGTIVVRLPPREPFGNFWVLYQDPHGLGVTHRVYNTPGREEVVLSGISPGRVTLKLTLVDDDRYAGSDESVDVFPEPKPITVQVREGVTETVEVPLPN